VNGHASTSERYSTRCATGVIQRKRYDRIVSDDDENMEGSSMYRESRRTPHYNSNSDDDHRPGKAIASKGQLKATKQSRHVETIDNSSESSSDSESLSSESSTEVGTDSELTDAYSDDARPSVSAGKTNRKTRSGGAAGRVTNGRHCGREESDCEYDDARTYRTRNRGRQTVHYNEDSEGERAAYNRNRKHARR